MTDAPDRSCLSTPVTVATGSRLHFGLLTHRPDGGREFGGVGVMVDVPGWKITVSRETLSQKTDRGSFDVTVGVSDAAARACPDVEGRIRRTLEHWNRMSGPRPFPDGSLRICVDRAVPGHRGLGSGTQLGLAVGRALSELAGEASVSAATLAERTGRGLRSAVGTWGFESGGLIVDGGKLPEQSVGTCVARIDFPADWRFLLVAPAQGHGLSGTDEVAAFEQLKGMPAERTARLCRIALMDLIPAIVDADINAASRALTEYGRISGDYFSPVQGGVYAHEGMIQIEEIVRRRGRGFLQTSWGPTCAALCAGDAEAGELQQEIQASASGPLVLSIARPLNRGATVARV